MADDPAETAEAPPASGRDRGRPLKVYVTKEERDAIEQLAVGTGLSVSNFLRKAGLGLELRSILDPLAVKDLVKASADLARLGNLFRMYLSQVPDPGLDGVPIATLVDQIDHAREELKARILNL